MSQPEYFDQSAEPNEYYENQEGGAEEFSEDFDQYAAGSAEEFEEPFDADGGAEEFEEPFDADGAEEFEEPFDADGAEEFDEGFGRRRRRGGKGKRRSLAQYLRMLVRYLIEAAVLVAVLYLLTPSESRGSLRDLAMMAVTFAAILILLDMFGGMGLAARLGAGLGVGFRMAGVASVL